jgi:hypothetical protein
VTPQVCNARRVTAVVDDLAREREARAGAGRDAGLPPAILAHLRAREVSSSASHQRSAALLAANGAEVPRLGARSKHANRANERDCVVHAGRRYTVCPRQVLARVCAWHAYCDCASSCGGVVCVCRVSVVHASTNAARQERNSVTRLRDVLLVVAGLDGRLLLHLQVLMRQAGSGKRVSNGQR